MNGMKDEKRCKFGTCLVIFILSLGICSVFVEPVSVAASEDPYFKGKVVEFLVCSTPGGGNDAFTRFLTRWLPNFIPGKPHILIKYMPGAGNLLCRNYVYNNAPSDGSVWVGPSTGDQLAGLLGFKLAKFDLREQRPVIGLSGGTLLYSTPEIAKNWDQVYEKELLICGFQPGMSDQKVIFFLLAQDLLGIKTKKMMFSYGGSGDMRRGFIAGEINFYGSTVAGYPTFDKDLEDAGELAVVMQLGEFDDEGRVIRKDPPVGHVPTVYELYKKRFGKEPSGMAWNAYKTLVAIAGSIDKTLCFPPAMDPKIWQIISEACQTMVKDPAFIADAQKRFPGLSFVTGNKLQKIFDEQVVGADPESMAWLKELMTKKAGIVDK